MKAAQIRELGRMAKDRAAAARTHYLWWNLEETHDMLQARIRAMIASGEAGENDEFITFTWTRSADDNPGD
jgi:hypothetical protein